MRLPWFPEGLILAAAVLGAALGIFIGAMHAIGRVTGEVTGSILTGLVRGLREWADGRGSAAARPSPRASQEPGVGATDPDAAIERGTPAGPEPLERLRPHIR
ncbi:MAG: hypothetical protein XU10_C0028G0006 [Chloroflexi bacterium CSP1-4]|nr:MAG: hypothetical protein XU10_C0028G0006 [Chloroflexi bacterium CSP1-4]